MIVELLQIISAEEDPTGGHETILLSVPTHLLVPTLRVGMHTRTLRVRVPPRYG